MIKTYSELCKRSTFEERIQYLSVVGEVGRETFGSHRYLNQKFYHSELWKRIKRQVIIRDMGHDLGLPDDAYEIQGRIVIHHMNPLTINDLINQSDFLLNPEYLVCVSEITHRVIHYGVADVIDQYQVVERIRNDTCPWKRLEE